MLTDSMIAIRTTAPIQPSNSVYWKRRTTVWTWN